MKDKIKKVIKDKINNIQDTEALIQVLNRLGFDMLEADFIEEMVWATIKSPIPDIEDDPQCRLYLNKNTESLMKDTKGLKLFFDGTWYINKNLNLKLRPEWIDIIKE